MKTIKSLIISLAMSLLFVNLAAANNYIPVLKVETGIAKKFYLALENVSVETSIRIVDVEGFTLVEESAAANETFEKVFNLENLKSGRYTLIIKSSYKETVQPITVTGRHLIVDESKRQEYFPAIINTVGESVNLSLLNPTKSQVTFSILNNAGDVLYRDVLKDMVTIEKIYDLSQMSEGRYTIRVNTSHETFYHNVNLR